MDLNDTIQMKYVVAALLYSGIGVLTYVLCFFLLDLLTPKVAIWKELVEKQNLALSVFLGAVAIGIAVIIASAIHG
jgi:putative membrane protein